MSGLGDQLAQGIAKLGVSVEKTAQTRLLDYLALLEKWNRSYNLTAVRQPPQMISKHLLDCLAILPYVSAHFALDVGSGAGLPGIPLAIARPQTQVTLLDSSQKKTTFLRQALIQLGLANVTVICERAETWRPLRKFDLVISRAFSNLLDFIALAGRWCAADGILAAMKGAYPRQELAHLPSGFRLERTIPLTVPDLNEARHLILIRPE